MTMHSSKEVHIFELPELRCMNNLKTTRKQSAQEVKNVPKSTSTAAKALKRLKQADYDKLVSKFRNVHEVCKYSMSFRSYSIICQ